jgi:hypothetical protein
MQYTVSMSSRMLVIASLCAFLLCVLLFLLGIELGKRFAEPAPPPALAVPSVHAVPAPALPAMPAAPAPPAVAVPAVKP